METFLFVAELCLFHTCIHFLHIRQDSVQLKILKGDVDLPN